jgi:hypothetical protein
MAAAAAAAGSSKQSKRSKSSEQQQYCYRQVPVFSGAVPAAGVRLWLVGDCDAAHETHGYWWSNPSLARAGIAASTVNCQCVYTVLYNVCMSVAVVMLMHGVNEQCKHVLESVEGALPCVCCTRELTQSVLWPLEILLHAATSLRAYATDTQPRFSGTDSSHSNSSSNSNTTNTGSDSSGSSSSSNSSSSSSSSSIAKVLQVDQFFPPLGRGIVFYAKGGRVRGAAIWGMPDLGMYILYIPYKLLPIL